MKKVVFIIFIISGCFGSERVGMLPECDKIGFERIYIDKIIGSSFPAIKEYGFKIRQTPNGDLIFFIPYWGDAYRFDLEGNKKWDLSFNSKSLNREKDEISFLGSTTPDFEIIGEKIFFLQSRNLISEYNLLGEELKTHELDIQGFLPEKIQAINDKEMLVFGLSFSNEQYDLTFHKFNLENGHLELIYKYKLNSKKSTPLVNLHNDGAFILEDNGILIKEINFEEKKISREINLEKSVIRDYEIYKIPEGNDYWSLSETERLNFKNDKTKDFIFTEDKIYFFHELNRGNYNKKSGNLLSVYNFSGELIGEDVFENSVVEVDECDNKFKIEKINGKNFVINEALNF